MNKQISSPAPLNSLGVHTDAYVWQWHGSAQTTDIQVRIMVISSRTDVMVSFSSLQLPCAITLLVALLAQYETAMPCN